MPSHDMTPAPAQPQQHVVVAQQYPSSPGSRSSNPLYDLADFESANSSVTMSESLDVASVVPLDVLPVMARFYATQPSGVNTGVSPVIGTAVTKSGPIGF